MNKEARVKAFSTVILTGIKHQLRIKMEDYICDGLLGLIICTLGFLDCILHVSVQLTNIGIHLLFAAQETGVLLR